MRYSDRQQGTKQDIIVKLYKKSDCNVNNKLLIEAFQSNEIDNNYNEASILRDENWINWRLLQSPFSDKYFFFLKDRSFIVVSIYNYQNKKRLNIIYSKCENNSFEILLNRLII